MVIKQLYNDNLRKLPNEYGDVSVMIVVSLDSVKTEVSFFLGLAKFFFFLFWKKEMYPGDKKP